MKPLERLLILSRENKSHNNIYKKRERTETVLRCSRESRVSVNVGSSISLNNPSLNCIQGSKILLGGSSPQMRSIFETDANSSLVNKYKLRSWVGVKKRLVRKSQSYMLQLLLLRLYGHSKKGQNLRLHPTLIFWHDISMSSNQRKWFLSTRLEIKQHCVL